MSPLLVLLVIPPIIYLVLTSFFTTGPRGNFENFTFGNYTSLVTSDSFFASLLNSCIYASGSALLAMVLGIAIAWIVEHQHTRSRRDDPHVGRLGLAAAFAVILLVLVLILLQWYRRLLRHAERWEMSAAGG